jgi:lysine-specific demethylase 8
MNNHEPLRIYRPHSDVFEQYLRLGQPVLLTGITEGWPAASWDIAALEKLCGDDRVPVERYSSDESRIGCWTTEMMPLRDYLAGMECNPNAYMSTVLINQHLPRLTSLAPYPSCISPARTSNNQGYYIFIGNKQRSETHFHPAVQAVLVNLHGEKRVGLYPPEETERLYAYPWYQVLGPERIPAFNWSQMLPGREDRFPASRRLSGYEFVMKPGEVLFIPIHWWHWCESLGPSISITLLFKRQAGDRISHRLALRSYLGQAGYALRAGAEKLLAR